MQSLILNLLLVFVLNLSSNALNTLKTIFVSKKIMKPSYFIVFVDAIVFTVGFKMVNQNNSWLFILVYALSKVVGTWLGDYIEEKMALGVLEISIFLKRQKAREIADILRDIGYTVTNIKGHGYNGNERFSVNIIIQRKELSTLKEILNKYGIEDATMITRETKSVQGKITTRKSKEIEENVFSNNKVKEIAITE